MRLRAPHRHRHRQRARTARNRTTAGPSSAPCPPTRPPPLPIVAPLFPPLANEDEPPALISECGAKPAAAAAPAADLPLRIALWSDGSLELRRGSSLMTLLLPEETRALVRYLERLAVAEEAGA